MSGDQILEATELIELPNTKSIDLEDHMKDLKRKRSQPRLMSIYLETLDWTGIIGDTWRSIEVLTHYYRSV